MTKPRYPAHVVHALARYPAKWCEECGAPILPRLDPPNSRFHRSHLEPLYKFQKKRFCSRGCARRARARKESQATKPPESPAGLAIAPSFPTPEGLHACQLTIGHAYAQPKGQERPMAIKRAKVRRFDARPITEQVADFITRTKGRAFTARDIAKAFDLAEPDADHLLRELADEGRIRGRRAAYGPHRFESTRP